MKHLFTLLLTFSYLVLSAQCNLQTFVNASSTTCYGGSDGLASVVAQGGSNYTYIWSNGSTNTINPNLPAGTYYVTVTSDTCVVIDSAIVIEPLPVEVNVVVDSNVICGGTATGAATATVSNGITPITYNWASNDNNASATMLSAGTQVLTVFDGNNCIASDTFTLTEPPIIEINETIVNESINGECDGSITINPTGGTGPLDFFWYNGDTVNTTITDLCSGNYNVVVIDSIGCSDVFNFTVNYDASINIDYTAFPELKYFPNPVKEQLQITGLEPNSRYTVFNNLGQLIIEGETTDTQLILNTVDFAHGVYYIKLENTAGKIRTFKVLKQ
jgi:hypothetical protein